MAFLNNSLKSALAAASPSGFSQVSASFTASRSSASQFLTPVRLDVGYAIGAAGVGGESTVDVVFSRKGHFHARVDFWSFTESFVESIS